MALNIKDPATEKSVRELAALTGETVTAAVRRAAEERLQRVRRKRGGRSLAEEIVEIGRRCAAGMPVRTFILPAISVGVALLLIAYVRRPSVRAFCSAAKSHSAGVHN